MCPWFKHRILFAVVPALLVWAATSAAAAEALSLDEALNLAQTNNAGLLIAKQNLKSARLSFAEACAQISVSGSYDRSRSILPPNDWQEGMYVGLGYGNLLSARYSWGEGDDSWSLSVNPFSLSEVLTILRARVDLQASEVEYRSRLEELKYEVTRAYYGALQNDAMLAQAELALQAANRAYEDGKAKEQAGLLARADVLRLQTAVYQQRAAVMQLRANAQLARTTLAGLLGVEAGKLPALAAPQAVQAKQYDQDTITRTALENRGEIALAEARVGLARFGVFAAGVAPLRGVSLQWVPDQSITARITIPIGSTVAGVGTAGAALESAKLAARIQRETISTEAMQAYLSYITAVERLEVMRLAMESAKEVARVTALRYDAGLATVAEKLDSDVMAQDAEQKYLQAQYDVLLAEAQIRKVTAGK